MIARVMLGDGAKKAGRRLENIQWEIEGGGVAAAPGDAREWKGVGRSQLITMKEMLECSPVHPLICSDDSSFKICMKLQGAG